MTGKIKKQPIQSVLWVYGELGQMHANTENQNINWYKERKTEIDVKIIQNSATTCIKISDNIMYRSIKTKIDSKKNKTIVGSGKQRNEIGDLFFV